MAQATPMHGNVDCHVTHLAVEMVEIKLGGCVHRLHLERDQEQPKKPGHNLSAGFCTLDPGHIIFEISAQRLGATRECFRKLAEMQSELIAAKYGKSLSARMSSNAARCGNPNVS